MHGAPLTLYNSLTRSLERFEPLDPEKGVRVYSCGPTVYNYAHIGNLRAYVFTDTLSRALTWKGWPLTHVINITDVGHLTSDADTGDDKLEAAARASERDIWEIAAHYTAAFKANIRDLNIREPSRWSVATDHIEAMLDFAKKIAPEHCYELDTGLYFDVSTVPHYGALAGGQDDAGEGRIDPVAGKRHPQDFAIWRRTPPGEQRQMEWDSPWGRGAPGWHLECSVMSLKYLGAPFDIHTGGIDHREIHHPNEIAQNQAWCGCADSGSHFWMHNNFLVDRTGKMSKSKGGFTTLQTLVDAGVHPLAYRLMCVSAHYRSELEFSPENLAAALTRLKRLVMTIEKLREKAPGGWRYYVDGQLPPNLDSRLKDLVIRFDEAISDDLNTPKALTVLDQVTSLKRVNADEQLTVAVHLDRALGLNLFHITRDDLRIRPISATIDEDLIEETIEERKAARAEGNFAASDAIRDSLVAAGVEVMDGDSLGWDWRPDL